MQEITKTPSKALTDLINGWTDSYIKSKELPALILKQAKEEGFTKEEIRTLVEQALNKRGLSERRIREILPAELKDSSKIRPVAKKEQESDSLRRPIAANEPEHYDTVPDTEDLPVSTIEKPLLKEEKAEQPSPNMSEDAVFTAKRLAKAIDDIRDLNIKIDNKDKTISQLQEAVKKDSFKTATDEMNVKTWDKIAIPMLGIELRKLPGQGWHFVKAKLEFVS